MYSSYAKNVEKMELQHSSKTTKGKKSLENKNRNKEQRQQKETVTKMVDMDLPYQ